MGSSNADKTSRRAIWLQARKRRDLETVDPGHEEQQGTQAVYWASETAFGEEPRGLLGKLFPRDPGPAVIRSAEGTIAFSPESDPWAGSGGYSYSIESSLDEPPLFEVPSEDTQTTWIPTQNLIWRGVISELDTLTGELRQLHEQIEESPEVNELQGTEEPQS